jgi:isoleucyl-tRNA synthetase
VSTTESGTYKNTVNLPKTDFDMRANAVKREPEIQQFWAENRIYEQLAENNPKETFTLHDGPPYANGALHIGHALNKILKDFINRYQLMQGRKVRYIPGWDCHGLPIELKVLQGMTQEERQGLTPITLRQKAKEFALNTVEQQKISFQRYGVWGDWNHPYLTLTPEYEAAQIDVFGQMVLKGYIYRGVKPVHWSPSSKTALAEAELEYPEGHTSRSIYTRFKITKLSPALEEKFPDHDKADLFLAIWTTTPWTIPANLAVSVNPDIKYAVVKYNLATWEYTIVAEDLVEKLAPTFNSTKWEVIKIKPITGKDLEGCLYKHPLFDRISPVVLGGDYITTETGTGLVHTAPGHGEEDFITGKKYKLPVLCPVNENGDFTAEAGQFQGLNVLKDGNEKVIEALQDVKSLIKEEAYQHKYPYDWRTKKPTIYRATAQWFASVQGFKELALKAISEVNWIPKQGENRITAMVSDRSDWCISRQRSWGVPIPVFYDQDTGEALLNEETINHVKSIIAQKGSDAWWELSTEELLPESYRNNGRTYIKGTDTMDVWFDSGSSWAAVAKQRTGLKYPVDMYLEGSDQHRGWFQSSLLTSVATNGYAPYKTVLTHGFVLDEQGRKMSKSIGNVVDPSIVIEGGKNQQQEPPYGADILRLWVSSVDYSNDVPIGKNILKQLSDVRGKIRNTARFLLGNLHDFNPEKHTISYQHLPELDRYMLHRITEVFTEITEAFEKYEFFRFFQLVQNFCVVDLSNFYLDIAKDRLYISAPNSFRRRSCQTVLAVALENLAKAIAPVLCHTSEDIWQYIPYNSGYKSVFQAGWVKLDPQWKKPELAEKWEKIRQIRNDVNKVLDLARKEKLIGSSLESKVLIYVSDRDLQQQLSYLNPALQLHQETPEIEEEPTVTVVEETIQYHREIPPAKAWHQIFIDLLQPFAESPALLRYFLTEYRGIVLFSLFLMTAIIPLRLMLAVLQGVNSLPVLGSLFELLGMFVTGKYLVTAKNRKELLEKVRWLQSQIVDQINKIDVAQLTATNTGTVGTNASLANAFDDEPIFPPEEEKQPEPEIIETITIPENAQVDELRYLFLVSQVEIVETVENINQLHYKTETATISISVDKAEGAKCDRCWNYSLNVGKILAHPLLCERCVPALTGDF